MNSKKIVSQIMIALLLVVMSTSALNIHPVKAAPATIIVPDNYATIQGAINAANAGDTIFVRNGTYYENVVVKKTLSLVGEDSENTIIDGGGVGSALTITTDYVVVTGFTIRNGTTDMNAGIWLEYANYCNITGNNIINNGFCGIMLESSSGNSVSGNNITANNGHGIFLFSSSSNSISGNNITANNSAGIFLYFSSNSNSISGNNITANNYDGVSLYSSSSNCVSGNNITNNPYGIYLESSSGNSVSGNNITNNTYGIILSASSNNSIFHNNFVNNSIQVYSTSPANTWDDGYPSGGNYWSDYNGTDVYSGPYQNVSGSDGIGDIPRVIDVNNTDHYPLENPYGSPPSLTYSLTIIAAIGGTTNPTFGTYTYVNGSSINVTAIPNTNCNFAHWELDTVNVGSTNPYTVLVTSNHTLSAVFTPNPAAPVGGYSIQITGNSTDPLATHLALIGVLAIAFTAIKRRTRKT